MKKYLMVSGFMAMAFLATTGLVQAKTVPNVVSSKVSMTALTKIQGSFGDIKRILRNEEIDILSDFKDDYLDGLIKKYKIDFAKGERLPRGISKQTFLRVKLLAYLRTLTFISHGLDGKSIASLQKYNNIFFLAKPYEKQYIIYPQIDGDTFTSINAVIYINDIDLFADKNYIYLRQDDNLYRLSNVNPKSFKLLNTDYSDYGNSGQKLYLYKDRNWVYYALNKNLYRVVGADAFTFEILFDSYNIIVAKDKNNVYYGKNNVYYSPSPSFDILPGADPETFQVIKYDSAAYAKDKNRVYVANNRDYSVHVLEDADPETFAVVKVVMPWVWRYYGKDGRGHIWLYDNDSGEVIKISGENPDTFDYKAHAKEYFGG